MLKRVFKIIAFFIIAIVGGIFADQIFWPYFVERPLFYQYRLEQAPVYVTEKKEITIQENTALKEAVEKVKKAVVGVRTRTKQEKILSGSGLIVTSDGLMVTLAELLPQGKSFAFFIDGKTPKYQVLKRDLKENLALVKIEEGDLQTRSFADFGRLRLGERVFLMGVVFDKEPSSLRWIPRKVVNQGVIRSFNESFLETTIFEKNSLAGSPLFDIEGRVAGLSTINEEGRVIAIPATKIKKFIGL